MKKDFEIDLSFKIKDLDNKEINESLPACQILANALATFNEGDPLKYISLALKLHECKPISIDASDRQLLINFVTPYKGFNNLVKFQILEELNKKE